MSPERWKVVERLFDAAVALPEADRADYLARACAGDDKRTGCGGVRHENQKPDPPRRVVRDFLTLRIEVESLLASCGPLDSFHSTVGKVAAGVLGDPAGVTPAGWKLGSYEIVREIGRGGMGEVYLALDTRLGRRVALKILPSQYTADAYRLYRFQKEARAASGLNHPNILVVHEMGEADGRLFIATEFVEGRTLREVINEGKLELPPLLDIAIQVTGALAAAHDAKIVRRDVKPENIMVRPTGT